MVGLAGVLLPGIGRRVYPLCRAYPRLAHDLEAEALAGLLQAVKGWPCGRDRVASRLVWAACGVPESQPYALSCGFAEGRR